MAFELRRPSAELADSFAAMRDAFVRAGEDPWSPATNLPATAIAHTDVIAYVDLLESWVRGERLPEGWVPGHEFWIVSDGKVVGDLNIRPRLNDWLQKVGGHIGYGVHPEYRNQGIATFALREALRFLAVRGVREALVTCRDDNVPSSRVIEKCGGRRIGDSPVDPPKRRRYLIPTT
ncbi:MAG TPA: GNAT family N-acetyltransferase [Candidatus Cybelea sp.]